MSEIEVLEKIPGQRRPHFAITIGDEDFEKYGVDSLVLNEWSELDSLLEEMASLKEETKPKPPTPTEPPVPEPIHTKPQETRIAVLRAEPFDGTFQTLRNSISIEKLVTLDGNKLIHQIIIYSASHIYQMEGDALFIARLEKNSHVIGYSSYPASLLFIGEYHEDLSKIYLLEFTLLDLLANWRLLELPTIKDSTRKNASKSCR